MKSLPVLCALTFTFLILAACGPSQPGSPTVSPTTPPVSPTATAMPPTPTPTPPPPPPTPTATAVSPSPTPSPTPFTTSGWSTTASTRTELSFAFPGHWDGSSPLTFGEGEFVKDPKQAIGVTFQIKLSGRPAALLNAWGAKTVGIVGIVTFAPESVTDGPAVTIARLEVPTKIAQGNGMTAQVAYVQRANDTLEVLWFAPTEQWEALQPVFQGVLESLELWRKYVNNAAGLQTMYVHDWLAPRPTWQNTGLWFRSADERTGLAVFIKNEIADPVQLLEAWGTERLAPIGLVDCTLGKGDRMDTLSGQWESKMGQCTDARGEQVTYEVAFVPNKDRVLEFITYAPSATWAEANQVAFRHLLGLMIDIRP